MTYFTIAYENKNLSAISIFSILVHDGSFDWTSERVKYSTCRVNRLITTHTGLQRFVIGSESLFIDQLTDAAFNCRSFSCLYNDELCKSVF